MLLTNLLNTLILPVSLRREQYLTDGRDELWVPFPANKKLECTLTGILKFELHIITSDGFNTRWFMALRSRFASSSVSKVTNPYPLETPARSIIILVPRIAPNLEKSCINSDSLVKNGKNLFSQSQHTYIHIVKYIERLIEQGCM